jgi:mRNA-degrading endonuclease RelE of RelBE toxin-antitoxin system
MSLEFVPSDYFATELKRLAKRYRGLADDYEAFLDSLKENPLQGTEIAPKIRKIRKIRMPITAKGRGKSGGARIITYNALVAEQEGKIYLLLIYDKADASNIKMNVVKEIIKDLGL